MGSGVDSFLDFLDRHQLIVWIAALAFYIAVAMSLSAPVGVKDDESDDDDSWQLPVRKK